MFKTKTWNEICPQCKKEYEVKLTTYPTKMEEGKIYKTYYVCPYCKHPTDVEIGPDQDIDAFKIEK